MPQCGITYHFLAEYPRLSNTSTPLGEFVAFLFLHVISKSRTVFSAYLYWCLPELFVAAKKRMSLLTPGSVFSRLTTKWYDVSKKSIYECRREKMIWHEQSLLERGNEAIRDTHPGNGTDNRRV